eukprot:TRINITY_DN2983_c0_g1_i3.p1 TRINITY_DN2983_c0_g1~~TRINITY_DN2983_c0_g1_i3.p1  ORF type:complete len:744 (-),score=297.46 TRINITY_DN2983_c0_g1_i3:2216-4447(-)
MLRSVYFLALVAVVTAYKYAIPFYRYPDAQWDIVTGLSSVQMVIFNPNSGPGSAVDPTYVSRVERLKEAGQLVGGYVHTSYGERPIADVKADIDAYFAWYPLIDGIFVDEAQSSATGSNAAGTNFLDYYWDIKYYVRSKGARKGIVLNHGTIPDEAYVELADIDCIFEGPFSDYVNFAERVPAWVHSYPPQKFWHIVHTTPYASNQEVVAVLRATNAHFLYVTDLTGANPYDSLPTWAVASPPPPPPPSTTGSGPSAPTPVKYGMLQLFYPGGAAYDSFVSAFHLDEAAPAATDAALGVAIITPASGPGTAANSDYVAEVAKLHSHGALAFGYIALVNAAKSVSDVQSEMDAYYNFYGVDGFYFDQTWSSTVGYLEQLASYAKSSPHKPAAAVGYTMLSYGPGSVDESLANTVDIVEMFTGTYASFVAYSPPAWALSRPASASYYTVTDVALADLDALVAAARDKNFAYLHATDTSPWTVPTLLPQLVAALLAASSAPPPPPPPSRMQLGLQQGFYPCNGCPDYDAYKAAFSLPSASSAATDAVLGFTTISPASGPGASANSDYVSEVGLVQSHGGRVLGYIALTNGAKPLSDVKNEIDAYYNFYGVDGFYFDQTWSATVSYIGAVSAYAKSSPSKPAGRDGLVALAFGFDPSVAAFADVADILQLFNDAYSNLAAFSPPAWAAALPPSRFYAQVSGVQAADLGAFISAAKARNFGYVYPSDSGSWTLPTYFNSLVGELVAAA